VLRALRARNPSDAFGTARASAAMMPLLGMGRDVPGGRMELDGDRLKLTWRPNASAAYYEGLEDGARRLGDALGATVQRPFGRFGRLLSVDDVAALAVFLLSDVAGPMTGALIDQEQRVAGAPC